MKIYIEARKIFYVSIVKGRNAAVNHPDRISILDSLTIKDYRDPRSDYETLPSNTPVS